MSPLVRIFIAGLEVCDGGAAVDTLTIFVKALSQ
jgi:hypothetical protein